LAGVGQGHTIVEPPETVGRNEKKAAATAAPARAKGIPALRAALRSALCSYQLDLGNLTYASSITKNVLRRSQSGQARCEIAAGLTT
jgi:hypothetical protein